MHFILHRYRFQLWLMKVIWLYNSYIAWAIRVGICTCIILYGHHDWSLLSVKIIQPTQDCLHWAQYNVCPFFSPENQEDPHNDKVPTIYLHFINKPGSNMESKPSFVLWAAPCIATIGDFASQKLESKPFLSCSK